MPHHISVVYHPLCIDQLTITQHPGSILKNCIENVSNNESPNDPKNERRMDESNHDRHTSWEVVQMDKCGSCSHVAVRADLVLVCLLPFLLVKTDR